RPIGASSSQNFRVGAGSEGDWWDVWQPFTEGLGGPLGLAYQYIDFPWTQLGLNGVNPYNGQFGAPPDTGAAQNMAQGAIDQAGDAASQLCAQYWQNYVDSQMAYNAASACANPSIWNQLTDGGGNLLYEERDPDTGLPTGNMTTSPTSGSFSNPAAYSPQRKTCTTPGYMGHWPAGYTGPAQAQSDANAAQNGMNVSIDGGCQAGCGQFAALCP
ncbi:MAG TPA: hypothetical protein VEI97_15770, partial [bacterium]|nr:hypothetical protein [bacterium]